jgi:hypothetical protein
MAKDYKLIAQAAAVYAYHAMPSPSRGSLESDQGITVVWDNCEDESARYQNLNTLRIHANECAIELLASATYPHDGAHDGYTEAMVFGPDHNGMLVKIWNELLADHFEE